MRGPAKLPLDSLEPFLLPLASGVASAPREAPAPLHWPTVFGNDGPVELEVGFGKGAFLVAAATAHPGTNYLGIEIDRGLQLYAATRLAKRSLANVKVACGDARYFLQTSIPTASLAAVHVYFPDPWWKKRHKKRRVFTAEFAAATERALVPGGRLLIATDVEEYFGVMTATVAERPGFCETDRQVEAGPVRPDELVTNFERKARDKGGPVWRAEYRKELP